MITIEEVQSIKSQFETDGITPASGETLREVCDLALSQREEIKRLRSELDLANKFIDQAFEAHPNLPLDIEFLVKSGEPK